MTERTLIILKPDDVQRQLCGRIIDRFEQKGLQLVAGKFMQISRELAETHYGVHKGKPFYDPLLKYITSGPVMVLVFEAERAFAKTMADRDHTAFVSFLSEEAVFLSGGTTLRGAKQVADGWKAFYETPEAPFSWEPKTVLTPWILSRSESSIRARARMSSRPMSVSTSSGSGSSPAGEAAGRNISSRSAAISA